MNLDLMKKQLIQCTTTTRSESIPIGTLTVNVQLDLSPADRSDPALDIRSELQILDNGNWRSIITTDLPDNPVTVNSDFSPRIRLIIDPSRPVSVGAIVSFS